MEETFIDQGLSESDRISVHNLALEARERLTHEATELMEGVYGLHESGSFEPIENLPALRDNKNREIYEHLTNFLDEEFEAGLKRKEAVAELVKEVAFTPLNRFVAFKMMEARKLIRETVSRGPDSNGFKFYLAEHAEDEANTEPNSEALRNQEGL